MASWVQIAVILTIAFYLLSPFQAVGANIDLISDGSPASIILVGAGASEEEKFASSQLNDLVERLSGSRLKSEVEPKSQTPNSVILIGTPATNSLISDFEASGLISVSKANLGDEGYLLKTIRFSGVDYVIVAASNPKGVIYGVYGLAEALASAIVKMSPIDLDFPIPQSKNLSISDLDLREAPFYPVRAALSIEKPDWLSQHRLNMSGAEGVWSGTGNDDGIATAFKYVDAAEFEDMQDDVRSVRVARIASLKRRFEELKKRGIESYLFMYITGEPTEALVANHPELLGPKVEYGASRNQKFYHPLCWSKPEVRDLIKRLTKEIVRTYPSLSGLHLRSWGAETRACNCPQCGDRSPAGQMMLWNIYFDIISATREIKPDFNFYLSNYDRTWLLDPNETMIKKLPPKTIISQKWGLDGEPTPDPMIAGEVINQIGSGGRKMIIISHDTEEVMPFWMVEGDLFAQGLRKYANDATIKGFGGFTIQGENGFGQLDKIISAQLNWNPNLDYLTLMKNYFVLRYGLAGGTHILNAIRINSWALSNYFADYAGTISFNGDYKKGSAALATRFWDLLGKKAVADTLQIQNLEDANYAIQRLGGLLPQQLQAVNEMESAQDLIKSPYIADSDYQDAVHLMKIWANLFESRLRLAEAVKLGFETEDESHIKAKVITAIQYSKQLVFEVKSFKGYSNVFGFTPEVARESVVNRVDEEIKFLQSYDAKALIRPQAKSESEREKPFAITQAFNYPNPFEERTTFIYTLTKGADDVRLIIYSYAGRRVATIRGASAKKGYNEEEWEAKDDSGNKLANGTYFYKLTAKLKDKKVEKVGKMSILR